MLRSGAVGGIPPEGRNPVNGECDCKTEFGPFPTVWAGKVLPSKRRPASGAPGEGVG